jgi:hypothetical protein
LEDHRNGKEEKRNVTYALWVDLSGYERKDREHEVFAHFSAPGLHEAIIELMAVFPAEALKEVMSGGEDVAPQDTTIVANLTAYVGCG